MSTSAPPFLKASLARDTVIGLQLEQRLRSPWIYWLLLLALAVSGAALPFIKVNVGVHAPGLVRARTERIDIRPPLAGRIQQLLVQEGDHVSKGQTLIQLDALDVEERLRFNRLRQDEITKTKHELRQLLTYYARPTRYVDDFNSDRELESAADTTAPRLQLPRMIQDERNVRAQLAAHRLTVSQAALRADRATALAAKGWITGEELNSARHEYNQRRADALLVVEQALARWEDIWREEDRLLSTLVSEQRRLEVEQAHHVISSPADGTLVDFAGWGPTTFITAGQVLGQVSPDDSLIVEALVHPKDSGHIRSGQLVRLRIDAFPSTRWGVLSAKVTSISADLTSSAIAQGRGFKVLIQPERTILSRPDGIHAALRKGLTLSAHFVVDRRSLWQLLHDRANTWLELDAKT